jgi:thiamine pyrophosphokinase
MKVYIFLHGGFSDIDFYGEHFKRTHAKGDTVISADGGYSITLKLGIESHYLIGDLDSCAGDAAGEEIQVLRYPPEKNFSDFELSLKKACELVPEEIIVYGALGGRKDHEFINTLLLAHVPVPTAFFEKGVEIYNIVSQLVLRNKRGCICSLVSLSGSSRILEMKGFRYRMTDEELQPSSRGLSNIIVDETALIKKTSGNLILIVTAEA